MIQLTRCPPGSGLEDRERFFLSLGPQNQGPSVVLATCDRVEVYSGRGAVPRDVARHLFSVTAGLDSPLLGENAVQGQVKRAYEEAALFHRPQGGLGSSLHSLFQRSLRVGKRIRSQTALGRGAMSHAQGAYDILKDFLDSQPWGLENQEKTPPRLLVLGVNKVTEDFLLYVKKLGLSQIFLGNRTRQKAEALAEKVGGQAFGLEHLDRFLPEASVVISATSAPHYILKESHIPQGGRPRLLVDLAVPRDIDPRLGLRPEIRLWNVDDIEARLKDHHKSRLAQAREAWKILDEELERYLDEMETGNPPQSPGLGSGSGSSVLPA